jgi:hypothetical protein
MTDKRIVHSEAKLKVAIQLWNNGITTPKIAKQLLLTPGALAGLIRRHRELFPRREPIIPLEKSTKQRGGKYSR